MKKKLYLLSLILLLTLCSCLFCSCSEKLKKETEKETENWTGGLEFTLLKNGTYELSGIGTAENVISIVIPAEYNGKAVTSIGTLAFSKCTDLTSITIPNSVTFIGIGAFSDCSGLRSITIPDGVTSISDFLFYGCSSLTSVTIPNSVTNIGSSAFCDCHSLMSITIPENVTSISSDAFVRCVDLIEVCNKSSLSISEGSSSNGNVGYYAKHIITDEKESFLTTTADGYIFYEDETNSYLMRYTGDKADLVLPQTSPAGNNYSIYYAAFNNCSSLTSITIPAGVTSIGECAFSNCSNLTSITIPASVTSIGGQAFFECSSLTSITIPAGVTRIGSSAFYECYNLTSITFTGTKAQWKAIQKGGEWCSYTPSYVVHCTDGDLTKDES